LAIQSLDRSELLALLAAAKAHRERDWLMILVAFWHGLRASEVVAIAGDDVRDGHLTVQRLKGSLRTTQPLVPDPDPLFSEVPALIEYAGNQRGNQRLFPITREHFWRLVQRHGSAAGLPAHKRHPHVLKHSIAMQTIHSAGIENVRQYLGHKSMSSTGEYLKVTDEAASAAIRGALPLKSVD
jgi:integrase/recombinase XerD